MQTSQAAEKNRRADQPTLPKNYPKSKTPPKRQPNQRNQFCPRCETWQAIFICRQGHNPPKLETSQDRETNLKEISGCPTISLAAAAELARLRLYNRAISGKSRPAKKRRSRCPLQLMLGRPKLTEPANQPEKRPGARPENLQAKRERYRRT